MASIILAFGASFIPWTIIRFTLTGIAIILFLLVAIDVAQSMLENDPGPYDQRNPVPVAKITPFQVVLAGVLAVIYSVMIFAAVRPLISTLTMPSRWTIAFTIPAICFVSGLVAWRNVRLWFYEAAEYDELLTEEKNALAELIEKERLKEMRLPSPSGTIHPAEL
ncbi:MAG TPA: hypothetical protein VGK24_03230 [Candidatus Angelobacter sp.]